MKTPICDFVAEYKEKNTLRLHMPGHKGKALLGFEEYDITEIDGADVLYSAKGIIRASEDNATALFGSGRTLYSTEGSSLSIRAMLYLASAYGEASGKDRVIVATRNAHKSFLNGAALLDLFVEWLYGDCSVLECNIKPEELDKILTELENEGIHPFAVYLTSPDYLGNILDIAGLSAVCHRHGVLSLVDNAHGAYLAFLNEGIHPLQLGADMCADSAHKTLPVLTGGGYLHISKNAPRELAENAEGAMSLFASSSPSYLILQSLDRANAYLSDGYAEKLISFCEKVRGLKSELSEMGYTLVSQEPLKITVRAKTYGYFGFELAALLAKKGIISEFSDRDILCLMLTPEIDDRELNRLYDVLRAIPRKAPIAEEPPMPCRPERVMGIRDALFSFGEELKIESAEGRILANASYSCPPAIAFIVSGERITEKEIELFKYYGISSCTVLKK